MSDSELNVDEFHKHEIMDRSFCIYQSFNDLIVGHPAASLMAEEIKAADKALAELYSKAGEVRRA